MEEACQSAVKYLSHTDLFPAQLEDWLDMTNLLRDAVWDSKMKRFDGLCFSS
ncbi:hypothetical protein [Allobaculum sp. Allo2]|uniref:hypothetical protein n=1 Tax=Allobaculum sp. Allo2 TaxID=2853432 RepID=UPI001F623092|nr:hypothetical protein [Allobaculum sp. Allo2]UNT93821.1 hypothetical protein KWG61_03615 [Allobaculum sp. Allo2]